MEGIAVEAVELAGTDVLGIDEDDGPVAPVGVAEVPPEDVVVSLALLGSAMKCLRKGFLETTWSRRLR